MNQLKVKVEAAKALVAASQEQYLDKAKENLCSMAYDAILDGKKSVTFDLGKKACGLDNRSTDALLAWIKDAGFTFSLAMSGTVTSLTVYLA